MPHSLLCLLYLPMSGHIRRPHLHSMTDTYCMFTNNFKYLNSSNLMSDWTEDSHHWPNTRLYTHPETCFHFIVQYYLKQFPASHRCCIHISSVLVLAEKWTHDLDSLVSCSTGSSIKTLNPVEVYACDLDRCCMFMSLWIYLTSMDCLGVTLLYWYNLCVLLYSQQTFCSAVTFPALLIVLLHYVG